MLEGIKNEFPVLNQIVNDEPLVYLDNAATTQKPLSVLSAIKDYYENDNANVHRGVHTLAERATENMKQRVKKSVPLSMLNQQKKSYLPEGQPPQLIGWLNLLDKS